MSFEELEIVTRDNVAPRVTLTYMPFRRKNKPAKDDAKPRLIVTLPTSVFVSK